MDSPKVKSIKGILKNLQAESTVDEETRKSRRQRSHSMLAAKLRATSEKVKPTATEKQTVLQKTTGASLKKVEAAKLYQPPKTEKSVAVRSDTIPRMKSKVNFDPSISRTRRLEYWKKLEVTQQFYKQKMKKLASKELPNEDGEPEKKPEDVLQQYLNDPDLSRRTRTWIEQLLNPKGQVSITENKSTKKVDAKIKDLNSVRAATKLAGSNSKFLSKIFRPTYPIKVKIHSKLSPSTQITSARMSPASKMVKGRLRRTLSENHISQQLITNAHSQETRITIKSKPRTKSTSLYAKKPSPGPLVKFKPEVVLKSQNKALPLKHTTRQVGIKPKKTAKAIMKVTKKIDKVDIKALATSDTVLSLFEKISPTIVDAFPSNEIIPNNISLTSDPSPSDSDVEVYGLNSMHQYTYAYENGPVYEEQEDLKIAKADKGKETSQPAGEKYEGAVLTKQDRNFSTSPQVNPRFAYSPVSSNVDVGLKRYVENPKESAAKDREPGSRFIINTVKTKIHSPKKPTSLVNRPIRKKYPKEEESPVMSGRSLIPASIKPMLKKSEPKPSAARRKQENLEKKLNEPGANSQSNQGKFQTTVSIVRPRNAIQLRKGPLIRPNPFSLKDGAVFKPIVPLPIPRKPVKSSAVTASSNKDKPKLKKALKVKRPVSQSDKSRGGFNTAGYKPPPNPSGTGGMDKSKGSSRVERLYPLEPLRKIKPVIAASGRGLQILTTKIKAVPVSLPEPSLNNKKKEQQKSSQDNKLDPYWTYDMKMKLGGKESSISEEEDSNSILERIKTLRAQIENDDFPGVQISSTVLMYTNDEFEFDEEGKFSPTVFGKSSIERINKGEEYDGEVDEEG